MYPSKIKLKKKWHLSDNIYISDSQIRLPFIANIKYSKYFFNFQNADAYKWIDGGIMYSGNFYINMKPGNNVYGIRLW